MWVHITQHWRTSLCGIASGVYVMLEGVPDFTAMSWKEIGVRAIKATILMVFGLWARDPDGKTNGTV